MRQFKSLQFLGGAIAGAVLVFVFLAWCGCGSGGGATAIAHGVLSALGIEFDNTTSGMAAVNVQAAIDEMDGRVDALDTQVTDAEAAIGSLDAASTDHGGRIGLLETEAADHESRIATLEGASVGADDVSYDNSTSGLSASDVRAAIDELASASTAGGSVFTRWGNTSAPTGTTKVYDGIAMAASDGNLFVMKGGDAGGSTSVNTYFEFVATDPSSGTLPSGITADRRVVACVCYCDRPTTIVYGTHTAPSGWTVLYKGYVLSTGTDNIVVDSDSFDASAGAAGSESANNLRLYRFATTHDATNYPASTEIKACVVKKN